MLSGTCPIASQPEFEQSAGLQDDWFGELAFVHSWPTLEDYCQEGSEGVGVRASELGGAPGAEKMQRPLENWYAIVPILSIRHDSSTAVS